MGRMRIKKKEKIVPFRETMAYRLLLITASGILFMSMFIQAWAGFQAGNRTAVVISSIIGVLALVGIFYNLDRARYAQVSEHASKRMRKR
jgi:formate hydrogenlyase subunit 3/multisubunit Na+/H+ antiporter MnhD subunit